MSNKHIGGSFGWIGEEAYEQRMNEEANEMSNEKREEI